jgi:HK97 gp10 family phage protein
MSTGIHIQIDQRQIAHIKEQLAKVPWHLRPDVYDKVLRKASRKIVVAAKNNVQSNGSMKSGKLQKSIKVLNRISKMGTVIVGPDYKAGAGPQAHLIEFGFVHSKSKKFVSPKPFMRPAYESTKNEVIQEITRNFEKALKKIRAK